VSRRRQKRNPGILHVRPGYLGSREAQIAGWEAVWAEVLMLRSIFTSLRWVTSTIAQNVW